MKKHFAALVAGVLLITSCGNQDRQLDNLISGVFPNLENGEVMVLPGAGCTSCITDAESSIDSLLKQKDFRIIFTEIKSAKLLKQRLKEKSIDWHNPNLFIDTADLYVSSTKHYNHLWAFPTTLIIKNKRVTKVEKR